MPLDKTKVSDTAAIAPDEAIALFDSLAPAEASQVIGKWRRADIETGHKWMECSKAPIGMARNSRAQRTFFPLIHEIPIWG